MKSQSCVVMWYGPPLLQILCFSNAWVIPSHYVLWSLINSSFANVILYNWKTHITIQQSQIIHFCDLNRPMSQISQCIRQISHNTTFCNRNVHTYAHVCYKIVHCGIWYLCIVVFMRPVSYVLFLCTRLSIGLSCMYCIEFFSIIIFATSLDHKKKNTYHIYS